MSDLKYRTPTELRSLIRWCVNMRATNRATWERKEEEVERLMEEIADLRGKDNNIGQKEAWARIYLARSSEAT